MKFIEPREQHFKFGKHILPVMVLSEPDFFIEYFTSEKAEEYLKNIWNNIGNNYSDSERIPDNELKIKSGINNDLISIGISLPEPISSNELHFIYVVAETKKTEGIRIFGLEKGHRSTFLIEWNKIGRITYEVNTPPDMDSFQNNVFKILKNKVQIRTLTDLRPMGWFLGQQ